ncbi:MAG: GTPase ObgE [Eubacterium sp.]|nr:GTPase ObgE [Eubacterium sp.]
MLVDKARIKIVSGKGGNGAVTFRREPFVPEGGPDGGDGGKGGDVIIRANRNLTTLMDFKYKKKFKAEDGQDGMRKKCFGKDGEDLIIEVPVGTMVTDEETGLLMADLTSDGQSVVAAKGGKGGKGNVHYKSSVRQAPDFAEAGDFAKERYVILELKMIADVGLVGFPNVGKSSILSVSTNARPKIDNYHFTTLEPNLGVVEISDTEFLMADIAGIIEGAHKGLGLGLDFLKHIERTRVLIHVVDVSGSEGRDPREDFDKIMKELEEYSPKMLKKPMIVCANKMDLVPEGSDIYEDFRKYVTEKGYDIYPVVAPTRKGVSELLYAALAKLNEVRENEQDEYEDVQWFDFDRDDVDKNYRVVNVEKKGDMFILSGTQLHKIFNSTNFNDTTSLRYLYKYIEKSGAIKKMKEMGLKEGDTVSIYDYEMEYIEEF